MTHRLEFLNTTTTFNTTPSYLSTTLFLFNTFDAPHLNTTTTTFNTSDEHRCRHFIVVVNVFIFAGLSIFGIIGNLLTFLVLRLDGRHHVACFLLQTLALNDASFLLLILFAQVIPSLTIYFEREDHPAKVLTIIFVYPLVYYTQLNTVWIKVFISFNRYVAICLPFKESTWNTSKRVKIQVVCLFVFVFIYTIPRFFEYRLQWYERMEAVVTKMKLSSTYQALYETYSYCLVVYFGPLSLLLVLNVLLIKELLRSEKKMKNMQLQQLKYKITIPGENKISSEKKLKKKLFELPIRSCSTHLEKLPTAEILQFPSSSHASKTLDKEMFRVCDEKSEAIVELRTTDLLDLIGVDAFGDLPEDKWKHLTLLTNEEPCVTFNHTYAKTHHVFKSLADITSLGTEIKESLNSSNSLSIYNFSNDIKAKNLSLYYQKLVPKNILKKFASVENFYFETSNTINTPNKNSIYKKETLMKLVPNETNVSTKKDGVKRLKILESKTKKQIEQKKWRSAQAKQMVDEGTRGMSSSSQDKDTNITLVMVAIVIVFVVCQTPGYINQVIICKHI